VDELRASGRGSGGVRGIRLEEGDAVVSSDLVIPGGEIVAMTALGAARRTAESDFPVQGRGGGGVRALKLTARTGPLVALRAVPFGDETLVVLTQNGEAERLALTSIKSGTRAAAPAPVVALEKGDAITEIAYLGGAVDTGSPNGSSGSGAGAEEGSATAPPVSGRARRQARTAGSARPGPRAASKAGRTRTGSAE
jgi:hypothetical protein